MKRPLLLLLAAIVTAFCFADDPSIASNANGTYGGSSGGSTTPDPVGYVDGTVYDTAVDLRVVCPDIDLVFRRHYDSQAADASPLGAGWTHACEGRVAVRNGETWVFFAGESGPSDSIRRFPLVASGESAFDRDGDELFRLSDGHCELVTPDRHRYVFNSAGRLASVLTWNGTRVTMVRESPAGPVVRAEHSDGKSLSFSYADGRLVRVDSPDPAVFVELAYAVHGAWHVLARVVRHDGPRVSTNDYSYVSIPSPGTRVSPLDPTHPRILPVLPRPSNGGAASALRPLLREKTDANGLSVRFCYIRPGDSQTVRCAHMEMDGGLFSTSLSYGENFTLERRPTAFGVSAMRFEYDSRMRETLRRTGAETTTRTYDAHDDLVRVETVNAETGGRLVRTAQYDARHRPVLVSSSLGATRTAPETAYAWNDVRGIPSRIVSPGGRVFAWTTNGCDMTVFGAGTNDARLVTGISCTTNGRPHAITGPDGATTVLTYGTDGLVSRIESTDRSSVGFSRDALGHVTAITDPGPDGSVRTTHFTVNGRGRPLTVFHPDGTSESFAYDGNGTKVVGHVDELGREDVYKWVLGLPIHAGRVTGGVTNALFAVSHDPQLNVVAITDPLGRSAESYVLDENERIVAVTNLEGQVLSRNYLVGDLVSSETRFDGTAVSYGYDSSANLASVAYPDDTLKFTHDNDRLLTSAANAAGTVTNAYDSATGWLDSSTGADGTLVSYLHSNGGGVTSVVSLAGTTRHALDAAGRRTRTDSPAGTVRYGYCPWNGLVAAVTNANGVAALYAYDIMDRVTNITWRTASGTRLGGFDYEYDALGRIVSRSHSLGTNRFDRVYAYDGMDRLASDGDVAYSYDAAGNRTTRTEDGETVTYTLGQGDRLAAWTGGAYEYDTAGCVTKITRGADTWDLAWNSKYQLVSVSTNGVFAESYQYDAVGRRVSTTNAEGTEHHVYDDNWQVIADLDDEDNVIRSYDWAEGVDRLLAVKIGTRVYTALTDVQGTVWGYADEQGAIVARWTYDAWGNVLSEEIAPSAAELRTVRYRFQGRERSAAPGLINFRMRWYDAEAGRWLSKDPIGLSGGLNLYEYCGGETLRCRDPFGLKIYYSDTGGGHSTVWVQDPFGCGYWMINFGPANGGRDNLTLNVLHGPSNLTLTPVSQPPGESGMVCMDTSAENDFWAIMSAFRLRNANLPYDLIGNNCAHISRAIMNAAGLGLGNPLFDSPSRLRDDLLK